MKKFISLMITSVVILGIGFVGVSIYGQSHARLNHDETTPNTQINQVIVYTTKTCPYCFKAKDLLNEYNISFVEKDLSERIAQQEFMQKLPGVRNVPQIFIGSEHVGGYSELRDLADNNQLMQKVSQAQ